MRLTLRTLLAYLDDTLEPAQAKLIGAKVAESEPARELMERIKQVTRRRRLTSPPASGPGGIDPNTIAEYLNDEVTPEKAAEVEQICLASDVHLAEIAACHQILTLVLGEPALVPPTAKQRMYGLVNGPESITTRKHKKPRKVADQDPSSAVDGAAVDSPRLGIFLAGVGKRNKLLLIVGSGVIAACLLVFAIWQLVHSLHPSGAIPKGEQHVKADEAESDGDKKQPEVKNTKLPEPKPPVAKPPEQKQPEIKKPEVVPGQFEYKPASTKQQEIGKYQTSSLKEPGVLLQFKADKPGWHTFVGKNSAVLSGRPLLSLAGSKSAIQLDTGVELTLWGNLPELTLDPFLSESRVVVHAHEQFDADVTLERGRIVLRNLKKDKNAQVRVRFENPTLAEEHHLDLVLDQDAAVVLERSCELEDDEPFYENPQDKMRKGPTAMVRVYAISKAARVRSGQAAITIEQTDKPVAEWQSRRGNLGVPVLPGLPAWLTGVSPAKNESQVQQRKKALEVTYSLARSLDNKAIDVAVEEIYQGAQKDLALSMQITPDIYFQWRHAIQASAAVDDIARVFDEFQQDTTPIFVRGLCMHTLRQWLAWNRDHDYQLLKVLQKNYRGAEPVKIMELFHSISQKEMTRMPERYQQLIDGLSNDLTPIRTLSHGHLLRLAPAGERIPYDPVMPRVEREKAVREWQTLIPPGQLPPAPPMKKEESK